MQPSVLRAEVVQIVHYAVTIYAGTPISLDLDFIAHFNYRSRLP